MNNLPLKPLKWHEQQGWFSTKSPLTEYQIAKQSDKYRVLYIKRSDQFAREATGFATIEEAKAWAWKHYNEKMQPYVKPMPTWIDASEFKLCTNCGKKCFMDSDEYYPMDGKGICHECQLKKRGR